MYRAELRMDLKNHFPWLGTDHEAEGIDGRDTVAELIRWYDELEPTPIPEDLTKEITGEEAERLDTVQLRAIIQTRFKEADEAGIFSKLDEIAEYLGTKPSIARGYYKYLLEVNGETDEESYKLIVSNNTQTHPRIGSVVMEMFGREQVVAKWGDTSEGAADENFIIPGPWIEKLLEQHPKAEERKINRSSEYLEKVRQDLITKITLDA